MIHQDLRDILAKYKEIVASMLFFGTLVVASFSFFAKESELKRFKCLTQTNETMIVQQANAKFNEQLLTSARAEYREAMTRLEELKRTAGALPKDIADAQDKVSDVQRQRDDFADAAKNAKTKSNEARSRREGGGNCRRRHLLT
jgi:septal ring factor EnvC (AmiA/AmiB activator)